MMANFMKPPRRSAVKAEPAGRYALAGFQVLMGLLAGWLMISEVSAAECRVSLSQPQVDYGLLRNGAKPGPHGVFLGKRTVRLSVVCPEASVIALRFRGAPADGQGFSFGRHGRFDLNLQQPVLDGKAVVLAAMHNRTERDGQLRPDQALMALAAGQPVRGRTFSALVHIDSYLSSTAPAVRDKTLLEGGGRFELVKGD